METRKIISQERWDEVPNLQDLKTIQDGYLDFEEEVEKGGVQNDLEEEFKEDSKIAATLGRSVLSIKKYGCEERSMNAIFKIFPEEKLQLIDDWSKPIGSAFYDQNQVEPIADMLKGFAQLLGSILISPQADSSANQYKNRYNNILPYKWNQITVEKSPGFYINASAVTLHGRKYLMTQGPLDSTYNDFLEMRRAKGASTIVALTADKEMVRGQQQSKCFAYWDLKSHLREAADGARFHVEQVKKEEYLIGDQQLILRYFEEVNLTTKEKETFVHFQVPTWNDGHIIEASELLLLLDRVDAFYKGGPIVVHCSAGVGRSGVFVAAHSNKHLIQAYKMQENKELTSINPCRDILLLRSQRTGVINVRIQIGLLLGAIGALQKSILK